MVTLQAAALAAALSGLGQTVMLDFYTDWCAPCRAMNPTVDALITAGYPVQRVNKDQQAALAAKYRVTSIPCFIMLVDGHEVDRVVGGTTYSRLERMCKMASAAGNPDSSPLLAMNAPPQARPAVGGPARVMPVSQATPANWNNPPSPIAQPFAQPSAQPVSDPAPPATSVSDTALLAASVRLRIEDPDGRSCGSGTIIDSRDGEALVLTCGHIFRDSKGKGRITVDLFGANGVQSVPGELVSFDLTRDVGLVAMRTPGPVACARIAPPDYRITRGLSVASVGCNNGDPPTVRHSYVASLNKYLGPPDIEVAGQPVEGRSGGGLFTSEGYVIGVCNAADPSDKEGLFAALASIYAELDKARLDFVYRKPSGSLNAVPEAAATTAIAAITPPPMPSQMPNSMLGQPSNSGVIPASAMVSTDATKAGLPAHERAALEEIQRHMKDGAEVVCIVRPRGNPEAKSEVIMLDNASAEFVRHLSANGRRQSEAQELSPDGSRPRNFYPTSLEVPKDPPPRRQILLEWKAPENRAPVQSSPQPRS